MATHYFASHRGGIEIVAGRLFQQLAFEEQEVVWIAGDATELPAPIGTSRPVDLSVWNLIEERIGIPCPIPKLDAFRKIKAEVDKADVVILHDCLYLSNMAAFLFARVRRVPIVIIQHIGIVPYKNPFLSTLMSLANATVTHFMLSHAQQVVFVSETVKAFFSGVRFKSPPEVVFNGVDTDLYRTLETPETKDELRTKYDLPQGVPVILFAGRFVEKKGIPILKLMADQRPDVVWAFAGWGPLDPREWNMGNVRVFSGLQNHSLAALYRACDVLVLPSVGEGFPLVMQEALASGLPVICGSETSTADHAMTPYVHGVPVYADDDARTANEFLIAIDDLIGSFGHLKGEAESRRVFVVTRYSWRNSAREYLKIASRLVSAPNSRQQEQ